MASIKYLHILFLVTLIALKVSAILIYVHHHECDGQIDDCELCDHAIHNQSIEFSTPPLFQGTEIERSLFLFQPNSHYKSVCVTTHINNTHFGRPPPTS